MPARKKSFAQFVADGTFLARRHAELLDSEDIVHDPRLRPIQEAYQEAIDGLERQQLALEFQKVVERRAAIRAALRTGELAAAMRELGRPGSAEQVINFFPRFLRWDDGAPFRLDEWQQGFVRDAFRRDRRRRRVFKLIDLGIPRGNGKTPLASGLGLHAVLSAPGRPKVFQAAGSKDQATIGLDYASTWVETSDLAEYLDTRSRVIRRRDGRGSFSVISAAGGLGHGRKPDVSVVDERWALITYAQTQTYTALETTLHKLPDAYLIGISTAGYDKTTQLGKTFDTMLRAPQVEHRREGFLTICRDVDAGQLMWWYGLPEGYELDLEDDKAVLRALKLANPGSWVDHRELLRALKRMRERDLLEWMRLALNAWTRAEGAWLRGGVWAALVDDDLEIPIGATVYVAVDAAHSYDTTAVAWAWRAPDGRIVLRAKVWSVRDEAPAHVYVDDFYDQEDVHVAEAFILGELARNYRIAEVVGDQNYFGTELRHLARRFPTAPLFPNSSEMTEAVQEFYRGVEARRFAHDGDGVFAAHVDGVAGEKSSQGYWRIRKLKQTSPIDACTAAIMAASRAALNEGGRPSITILA